MNRDELDAFFARADDVLTDWHGSSDAAAYYAPTTEHDWPVIRQVGPVLRIMHEQGVDGWAAHAIYRQRVSGTVKSFHAAMAALAGQIQIAAEQSRVLQQAIFTFTPPKVPAIPTGPADQRRAAALDARRNRNTGPTSQLGLDGHYRRAARA